MKALPEALREHCIGLSTMYFGTCQSDSSWMRPAARFCSQACSALNSWQLAITTCIHVPGIMYSVGQQAK